MRSIKFERVVDFLSGNEILNSCRRSEQQHQIEVKLAMGLNITIQLTFIGRRRYGGKHEFFHYGRRTVVLPHRFNVQDCMNRYPHFKRLMHLVYDEMQIVQGYRGWWYRKEWEARQVVVALLALKRRGNLFQQMDRFIIKMIFDKLIN